jgi:hypothetical protein
LYIPRQEEIMEISVFVGLQHIDSFDLKCRFVFGFASWFV